MTARVWHFLFAVLLLQSAAAAEPSAWATKSARTTEKGRLELGAFSSATWGVTERVEVAAHPLGLFLFPSARVKINWAQGGVLRSDEGAHSYHPIWWFSSQHRLFVPTPFLHLIAREGSGGLLPANSEIPFALGVESVALLTRSLSGHLLTGSMGVTLTGREKSDLPLVEFPFLYSTLSSLYSPIVLSPGGSLEGTIIGPIDYKLVARVHIFRPHDRIAWPSERPPWVYAQDTALQLHARLGERHRISLGLATTIARYPIGTRLHYVPTLDYRVSF